MKRLTELTVTGAAATSLISPCVYAAASNDATCAATPAISLSQAIAAAEQRTGGRATRAE